MIVLNIEPKLFSPLPYTETLWSLIHALYISLLSHRSIIHPIHLEYIGKVKRSAYTFLSSTTINDQAEVVSALLSTLDDFKVSNSFYSKGSKNTYIPIKTLARTLREYTDFQKTMPREFYEPLFCILSNQQYVGEASFGYYTCDHNNMTLNFSNHTSTNYRPELSMINRFDNTNILTSHPLRSFGPLYIYLYSFNIANLSFDQLVKVLLYLSLPTHSTTTLTFSQIIRRVIATANLIDTDLYCTDQREIAGLLRCLDIDNNKLDLKFSYWLSYLYKYMGLDSETYSYITKKKGRTIAERDSFVKSFLGASLHYGLEAAEEEKEPTEEDGTADEKDTSEDPNLDEDKEADQEETSEEEDPALTETETEEPTQEEKDKLKDSMLNSVARLTIEFAENETEEDILYKETICNVVRTYRENPPSQLTQEELLLLEIWCAQWIFLVSAKTTKQLLGQLSITISLD